MGKSSFSRAGVSGTPGAITTTSLQTGDHKDDGFGVFAYYTGVNGYGDYDWFDGGSITKIAANFMFNQQVKWNNSLGNDYITKWEYAPIKYWPNEVATTSPYAVDDQNNDTANDPATSTDHGTSEYYGGKVSFFAYAPYVALPITGAPDEGIIKINNNTTVSGANDANDQTMEPTLTYVVPKNGSQIVDLLWGTQGETSQNVLGTAQSGTEGTANPANSAVSNTSATYIANLLKPNKTNIDLTKQKTNGKVEFAFKHALAKVGGSTTPVSGGGDVKNGLMVVLDIDDMKGAEVGGDKTDKTKVTVKEVKIVAHALVEASSKKPGEDEYTDTYLKTFQGDLNLATGQWGILTTSNTVNSTPYTGRFESTTKITQTGDASSDNTVSGQLNTVIAEPSTWSGTWASNPAGVETTAKNVYQSEAAPLVFIPGTYPELLITIDYIVRTEDTNLSQGYSQVEQVITKKLTFTKAVELNKQYSILMHLGLTSVKFSASVSDWEVYSDSPNYDSDGNGTLDIHVEDVFLPINVAGLMTTYSATELASTATTLTLSSATLYDYSTKAQQEVKSSTKLTVSGHEPAWQAATWLRQAATPDNTVILTANTTFTDRTANITATYTPTGSSNNITEVTKITQKGRIAESAKITFSTDPTSIAKAGEDKTYAISAVTASGKESDNSTAISDQTVDIDNEVGDIVFKDVTTGQVVNWIYCDKANGKFVATENNTGAVRSAKIWIYIGGKLVESDKTVTQSAS